MLILFRKRDDVRNLFTFRICDSQYLTAFKQQCRTGLWRKVSCMKAMHPKLYEQ